MTFPQARFGAARWLPLLAVSLSMIGGGGCASATATDETDAAPATAAASSSETTREPPTIAAETDGLDTQAGLLTVHQDRDGGRVLLEVPPPTGAGGEAARLLLVSGLRTGLGSNDVGLDRGQWGDARLVVLRRVGHRVLLEQPNLGFRALTDDPAELRATAESFAPSVLWAADVVALDPDGTALIDLSSLLLRDDHQVVARLKEAGQGSFTLDASRSLIDPDATLAFPDNLEFEATLTFRSDDPGPLVWATAPDGRAISFVQHVSLVRLPDDAYVPREHDPRTGAFAVDFLDYAAPLDAPLRRSLAQRHRLQKTDPGAARSPVKEPIVYYVDPGAPEPVRSALLDGARWWADAFAAAGFADAFRVELLPEGVHPLDVRYNVIEWIHRSTRGWSYGHTITDPRTGEILKGHVSLGSLRVRQDRVLFEGLLGTDATGSGAPDDPIELSLARIRQLSAHEVGHTLGFAHNFAASVVFNGSVMDYPAPDIGVGADGSLDVSRVYGVGVGPWDRFAVQWLYGEFAPGTDEAAALDALVRDAVGSVPPFLSDADARPAGSAHPQANLWDNGADPVAALERSLAVRRVALESFGEDRIAPGVPVAHLQEVLAPVYFHHRYQLDAAVKTIGGLTYEHALRGDGRPPARLVDPVAQQRALEVVLSILEPEQLDLPEPVLALLLPRPQGEWPNREMFGSRTTPAFDALGAAATASRQVVDGLLQRERCARLVDFRRRDAAQPGLDAVLHALEEVAFSPDDGDGGDVGEGGDGDGDGGGVGDGGGDDARHAALRRVVQRSVVDGLLERSLDPAASSEVRAATEASLRRVLAGLQAAPSDEAEADHRILLAGDIRRHIERTRDAPAQPSPPRRPPPGSPIGTGPVNGLTGCSLGP